MRDRHVWILALVTVLAAAPIGASGQSPKPNILVIFGDDIGILNVSAYGRGVVGYTTPNIDRIAAQGAIFSDYYGQQSCTAGRSAFITGQVPFRTGMSKVGLPGAPQGLQKEDPTIAELLKPQGYVTGQFGKNHLGDRDEFLPTAHGFDEFFGNLYHLNAEEEPENEDYPKNPEFRKKYGPRGVIRSSANPDGTQRSRTPVRSPRSAWRRSTGKCLPPPLTSSIAPRKPASRSSSGSTPPACTTSKCISTATIRAISSPARARASGGSSSTSAMTATCWRSAWIG